MRADEVQVGGRLRRRGDKHRQAILAAVRALLEERPFSELSVSTISQRAGVARSGFYFYFESKYSVLAQILTEAARNSRNCTQYFAPRQPGELRRSSSPPGCRQSAALVYAHNLPVVVRVSRASHEIEIGEIVDRLFRDCFAR